MIIRKQNNQLVLLRQDEHDDQCGQVARLWGTEKFQQLKDHETVSIGIENHDTGWTKPDDDVLFNEITKRPMNFMDVDLPNHVDFYESGYRQILDKNPYSGLLLGLHWIGLYTSRYGNDPTFTYKVSDDLKDYMNSVITRMEKEFAEKKLQFWTPKQARSEFDDNMWMQFEFFQVMDRMSLFLAHTNPKEEKETVLGPIRPSRQEKPIQLTLKAKGNGIVVVDPFPFAMEFETVLPVKLIEDRDYANQQDAKEAVEKAVKEETTWKVIAK